MSKARHRAAPDDGTNPVVSSGHQNAVRYAWSILIEAIFPTEETRSLIGAVSYGDMLLPLARGAALSKEVLLEFVPSHFFEEQRYGLPGSMPELPLETIEGSPLLYGKPVVASEGDRLVVHADIIASTFFLVTRYEEMVRRDVRDEHGRFPGRESLAYRAGFIDRPIVEEYAALLRKWLRAVGVAVPEPKRRFTFLPTHDVDRLRFYSKWHDPYRVAGASLLGRNPSQMMFEALGCAWRLRKDPWASDVFDEMIRLDELCAKESVYFFMAGGASTYDGGYDLSRKDVTRAIEKVREAGASIGLHASYEAGQNPQRIAEEKARLEEVCGFPIRRNRHHYLAWREIEDGWELAKAGIDWDSTMGYPDVAGFRLGVCHPIPLFDPVKLKPMGIEEHPLIAMDGTLSYSKYMNLSEEEAFSYCKRLADETRKHKGEFVTVWHNTSFSPHLDEYHHRLYRRLISYLFAV
jgi:hypothetical protein